MDCWNWWINEHRASYGWKVRLKLRLRSTDIFDICILLMDPSHSFMLIILSPNNLQIEVSSFVSSRSRPTGLFRCPAIFLCMLFLALSVHPLSCTEMPRFALYLSTANHTLVWNSTIVYVRLVLAYEFRKPGLYGWFVTQFDYQINKGYLSDGYVIKWCNASWGKTSANGIVVLLGAACVLLSGLSGFRVLNRKGWLSVLPTPKSQPLCCCPHLGHQPWPSHRGHWGHPCFCK